MGASAEFTDRIRRTETMQELLNSLDEEPEKLLRSICSRYEETGRAVADHYLQLTGFFGETMLRVLVGAGLIERMSGGRGALISYEPTEEGLRLYHAMMNEKRS